MAGQLNLRAAVDRCYSTAGLKPSWRVCRIGIATTLLMVVISTLGCGPGEPTYYPVSGTVKTKAGAACDGALIVFHPQDESRLNDPKPVATCEKDGSFSLTTMQPGDGAAAGEYGVTVVWIKNDGAAKFSLSEESSGGKDRLGGRYGQPQAPKLSAQVEARDDNVFDFVVE